ncbi:MAG: hypothetical protein K2Y29_13980 [Beijerinckiaceae bacterium]|nr:hypothetical protein [Beijerinckiaceae bacterium]
MSVVQRGVFGSSIWLGFMMSDAHLLIFGPVFALVIAGALIFSEFRRSDALHR